MSEQLRAQIERLVLSGGLPAGARLPTVRDLATDLGLARGTVNKVYDALARDGLVETRGRHGTVVLAPAARPEPAAARADLDAAADALVVVAAQLGLDARATYDALADAWHRLRPAEGAPSAST
ncbi:GntR family transcriptional regulator [Luteimicrobium sp. DT211]|uniref:GntR family transcriptional regulator n=1 Tax=Luteimicrobium sp. DT211 TaxID=3393412 RepID=UPI003CEE3257